MWMTWQKQIHDIITRVEREAYQRGYDAAIERIVAAASPARHAIHQDTKPAAAAKLDEATLDLLATVHGGSVIAEVKGYIEKFPGQRGADLVELVAKAHPDRGRRTIDRTVRTALHRLKTREKVEVRDGQWWPSEGG